MGEDCLIVLDVCSTLKKQEIEQRLFPTQLSHVNLASTVPALLLANSLTFFISLL